MKGEMMPPAEEYRRPSIAWPELGVALLFLASAAALLSGLFEIKVPPIHRKSLPTVIPMMVIGAVVLVSFGLLLKAIRGGWRSADDMGEKIDWPTLAWVIAGIVLGILLYRPGGFIVASVVMFMGVARGFGSRAILRDLVIAVILAVGVYYGFTTGLGLPLPQGVLAGLL
jgi:putative tricarboxylic transport membrane protein